MHALLSNPKVVEVTFLWKFVWRGAHTIKTHTKQRNFYQNGEYKLLNIWKHNAWNYFYFLSTIDSLSEWPFTILLQQLPSYEGGDFFKVCVGNNIVENCIKVGKSFASFIVYLPRIKSMNFTPVFFLCIPLKPEIMADPENMNNLPLDSIEK